MWFHSDSKWQNSRTPSVLRALSSRIPKWLSALQQVAPTLQLRRCEDWGPATHLLEGWMGLVVKHQGILFVGFVNSQRLVNQLNIAPFEVGWTKAHMILGVNHQVENQSKEDMGRRTTAEQLWVDTMFSVERQMQIGNPVGRTPKFSDT